VSKGHARWVHHFGHEWLRGVGVVDAIDRHRHLLPTGTGKGHIDIAFVVNGGICDRMQVVGDRGGDPHFMGVTAMSIGGYDHAARRRARGNTGHNELVGAYYHRAVDLAKTDFRPPVTRRPQSATEYANLAARQSAPRFNVLDMRFAV
jgi:hypothetical protein